MKKFDKTTGSHIPKEESAKLIENYAKRFPHETKYAIFGKDILLKLLTEYEGCEGIKISFGATDDGHIKPVLTAVNKAAEDLSGSDSNASVLCPPHCN